MATKPAQARKTALDVRWLLTPLTAGAEKPKFKNLYDFDSLHLHDKGYLDRIW